MSVIREKTVIIGSYGHVTTSGFLIGPLEKHDRTTMKSIQICVINTSPGHRFRLQQSSLIKNCKSRKKSAESEQMKQIDVARGPRWPFVVGIARII